MNQAGSAVHRCTTSIPRVSSAKGMLVKMPACSPTIAPHAQGRVRRCRARGKTAISAPRVAQVSQRVSSGWAPSHATQALGRANGPVRISPRASPLRQLGLASLVNPE